MNVVGLEKPTKHRGADTRASLLAAGTSLFAARGFDGTSVREITREAETNLGAITYHFGSKRALYEAVLHAALTPLADKVGAAANGSGTPMERLDSVVDVFFEHLAVVPEIPRLLLREVAAGKPPPDQVLAILRRNIYRLGGILSDGQMDGSMRPSHPLLTAISVVSQPVYMSVMAPVFKAIGGIDLQDRATRNDVAHHVKTFVRAGLAPREESRS